MASSDDESYSCPIASFYKLILKPRLDLQRLRIPRKFMITHGNDLSNTIYLKTPPGDVWKFDLVREDDKAFLQKGWPEFVEFHSLDHDHFLMFHYQGDSHFDVVICDPSASEIMYPYFDSDACNERPSKKSKQTHDLPRSTLSKKAKDVHKVMNADKLIVAKTRGTDLLTPKEDKRIRAYAAYQCKHPSFARNMQASFINPGYHMGLPKEFARKFLHLEPPFECMYNLQTDDDDGKSWPVKLFGEKTHVRFKSGWKTFVSENKLKVGDNCIFELINKQVIKVHILRN